MHGENVSKLSCCIHESNIYLSLESYPKFCLLFVPGECRLFISLPLIQSLSEYWAQDALKVTLCHPYLVHQNLRPCSYTDHFSDSEKSPSSAWSWAVSQFIEQDHWTFSSLYSLSVLNLLKMRTKVLFRWAKTSPLPFSQITKLSLLLPHFYLHIAVARWAVSQQSCTKWILRHPCGEQTADWKGFHAWMLSFCLPLDSMAATFLYIIKGTGICHLPQSLASPREPPEKVWVVSLETSCILDAVLKAQAASTQEGPCLNRKEQTV